MANITVCGGTGYIGRALIERLVADGHSVTALARSASRSQVPGGARVVEGSALDGTDIARALTDQSTLVLLVGTPRPNPFKAREFNAVDLQSVNAAVSAIRRASVAHVVYVSVAHPAPVMKAYIAVRTEGERLLTATGVPLTVLRPWYVLGTPTLVADRLGAVLQAVRATAAHARHRTATRPGDACADGRRAGPGQRKRRSQRRTCDRRPGNSSLRSGIQKRPAVVE